jgi:hypothetical protein
MYGALSAAGISPAGQRGIHILFRLAQDGLLCFGPRRGNQHTFVLLEEWLPPARVLARDEALAELALRYFRSHGPATVKDFAWWTGITGAMAGAAVEDVRSRLAHEEVDGVTFWGPDGSAGPTSRSAAFLLPPFDELLVGYRDRSPALDRAHVSEVHALLSPTIAVGGRIVGTWLRREARGGTVVTPRFFEQPSDAVVRGVARAARRYARFTGNDVTLDF